MTTRRLAPALALAFAAAATAALPSTAAAKTDKCKLHGTTTLASNGNARVYSRDGTDADGEFTTDVVYGCWRSSGRRVYLAREYDDGYVASGDISALKLSGRFVVYVYTAIDVSCKADCPTDYDPSVTQVSVTNLKTRRQRTLGGGDIDAKSLKVSGNTATWTADGKPQSATLR